MSDLAGVQNLIRAVVTNVAGHALSQADLNDLVQETNLKALTHKFDEARGSLQGWVSSIARNLAIDAMRRVRRQAIPDSDSLDAAEHNEYNDNAGIHGIDLSDRSSADIIEILTREHRLAKIQQALAKLHPDDQHFMIVSLREDYDCEKYAAKLGVSPISLRVRKHRLGERLRQIVAKIDS